MKDPRFEKLKCDHKGTYADDCIMNRVRAVRKIYYFIGLIINH